MERTVCLLGHEEPSERGWQPAALQSKCNGTGPRELVFAGQKPEFAGRTSAERTGPMVLQRPQALL